MSELKATHASETASSLEHSTWTVAHYTDQLADCKKKLDQYQTHEVFIPGFNEVFIPGYTWGFYSGGCPVHAVFMIGYWGYEFFIYVTKIPNQNRRIWDMYGYIFLSINSYANTYTIFKSYTYLPYLPNYPTYLYLYILTLRRNPSCH